MIRSRCLIIILVCSRLLWIRRQRFALRSRVGRRRVWMSFGLRYRFTSWQFCSIHLSIMHNAATRRHSYRFILLVWTSGRTLLWKGDRLSSYYPRLPNLLRGKISTFRSCTTYQACRGQSLKRQALSREAYCWVREITLQSINVINIKREWNGSQFIQRLLKGSCKWQETRISLVQNPSPI